MSLKIKGLLFLNYKCCLYDSKILDFFPKLRDVFKPKLLKNMYNSDLDNL